MSLKITSDAPWLPPSRTVHITLGDGTIVTPDARNIVSVECISEDVLQLGPAQVLITFSDNTTITIRAVIEYQQGTDGGLYPVVEFERVREN